MVLILGFVAAAFAAMRAMDSMQGAEPALAQGVTTTVKSNVIQAIVSGIGQVICALLGIRSRQLTLRPMVGRHSRTGEDEDDE